MLSGPMSQRSRYVSVWRLPRLHQLKSPRVLLVAFQGSVCMLSQNIETIPSNRPKVASSSLTGRKKWNLFMYTIDSEQQKAGAIYEKAV